MGRALALALAGLCALAGAARAQQDDQDLIELKDGRRLRGVIVEESATEVRLRVDLKVKPYQRAEIAAILYREQAALERGRGELAGGQLDEALERFQKVLDTDRSKDGKWKQQAAKELEKVLRAISAQRYLDVVWVDGRRRLFGTIVEEDEKQLRLKLEHGEIAYERQRVTRILRKEQSTLLRGEELERGGDVEAAIELYRKIQRAEDAPGTWRSAATDRLIVSLAKLADDARSRDDLEQAEQLLARARALTTRNPAVEETVGKVAERLSRQLAERRARATALVTAAEALIAKEAYREAYPKLVEAINLEPDRPGLRDLLDRCLSNIQVLAYGDFDDPGTLDPITSTKAVERRLGQFMHASLITRDAEERFVPELARDGGVAVDARGTTFTFDLRQGVRWSDGSEVTARDVEFSLKLLTNPKTANYNPTFAQYIDKVEVLSPYRIRVTLRRPFYRPLSLFSFKIVPQRPFTKLYLTREDPYCRNPVTSGPFRYDKGLGSRLIELSRNPHYHEKGKPHLSGARLKRYQDRQSARNDLERGDLHLLTELRPLDVDFFEKQKNRFTVRQYRARSIYFLGVNYRRPIFRDTGRELRRAIAHVIDRQAILEQFFNAGNPLKRRGGQAHALITGPYPYNSWAYNDAVPEYSHDRDLAARMLADVLQPLGWTRDGNPGTYGGRRYWMKDDRELVLRLKYPKGDLNVEKACIFIADSLRRIGLRIRLAKKAPRDLYEEVYEQHDFDLVYARYTFDDTYDVYPLFDPRRMDKGGSNFCGYVNPALVRLFDAMQKTRRPRRILALARRVHQVAHDESAMIWLWQLDQYAAHVRELRNVEIHPYHLFSRVERWKILRGPSGSDRR